MGTVICAGIVPELRWTATVSSGTKWIRGTHGQEDEQSTTSEYGTRVHVIMPELVEVPIIHISLLCCEAYYLTRHISHVYDMESPVEGIRIAIHVHSTDLCVVLLSHRISLPKIKSSETLLSTSMPKVVRRDRKHDF